jgi:hypothetical protein
MVTRLEKPLKREIEVDGATYVVTLEPERLRITKKGKRKGLELPWAQILSGDAGLAAALQASVASPSK